VKRIFRAAICISAFLAILAPAAASAESVFDGTWKIDLKSMKFDGKPMVLAVRDVMYQCKSCPIKAVFKSDGSDQRVIGSPYADTFAAHVVDKISIETVAKKSGKEVAWAKLTASADGNTLTMETRNTSPGATPSTSTTTFKRVAKDPSGTHVVAGSWKLAKFDNRSDNALTVSYKIYKDNINLNTGAGFSYNAKTNGAEAVAKGDLGINGIAVKLLDQNTLEETARHNGSVISVTKTTVDATGKSATVEWIDKVNEASGSYVMTKQ